MASPPHEPPRLPTGPGPSWDDLRIFLAVVAHGSLNGAAKALRQSQPTIARRLRALEEALGVPLVRRGPNRLALTEAGRAVLEAASPMAEAASAVPRAAAAYRADPHAPVRITATASVTMFLSQHAPALSRAASPAEVAFLPTRRRLDLAAGEADIALRMGRLPDAPELVARRIGTVAFGLYAHREAPPDAVIAPPEDPDLSRQAALVVAFAEGRTVVARISDMPTRYQATRARLGTACLPCWLGDSDPDLVRLPGPPEGFTDDVYLILHRADRRRRDVARVAEALADLFRREAAALVGRAAGARRDGS
ncbi:MAG TPA: LysR family transcriptional regulator [Microvirga sp.]|jgi:DNA-binding transcriptional LysR family regulator|nr:LysR family transcriptional regulator [Microvirga sp.]